MDSALNKLLNLFDSDITLEIHSSRLIRCNKMAVIAGEFLDGNFLKWISTHFELATTKASDLEGGMSSMPKAGVGVVGHAMQLVTHFQVHLTV